MNLTDREIWELSSYRYSGLICPVSMWASIFSLHVGRKVTRDEACDAIDRINHPAREHMKSVVKGFKLRSSTDI